MMERRLDPHAARSAEAAEGTEVFGEQPDVGLVQREHEEAQGVEVFVTPDAVVPAEALREGAPGHEILSGSSADIAQPSGENAHEHLGEEPYPEF